MGAAALPNRRDGGLSRTIVHDPARGVVWRRTVGLSGGRAMIQLALVENGLATELDGTQMMFRPFGSWIVRNLGEIEAALDTVEMPERGAKAVFDLAELERIDVAGAWLIHRTLKTLAAQGSAFELQNVGRGARILLEEVAESDRDPILPPVKKVTPRSAVESVGRSVSGASNDLVELVLFVGNIVTITFNMLRRESRLRLTSIIYHLELMGLRAVPIVMLITFVIGLIVSQQAIYQLKAFGAEQLSVNFIGIVILRELGVLLTAIMVAGRSGSSITAEIGAMRMREEIDAVNTLALNPIEVIVVPRLTALVIAVPILTFLGNLSALTAAALVSLFYGGIPIEIFIERLRENVDFVNFTRGMVKAPFMAFMIGVVAIMEGMRVGGSTDSLGRHTTASVVKSIFLVIVVDGLFVLYYAFVDG
jgi:phospholipid/cholesterol/gamma-HCH transport system permease protein